MREFSMKDKIGYTLGDLGCCCTEQFRAMFLTVFYTLVLKVNPLHVGTILLITKIWDAINDPIIGALIDARKSTKGGRFIPWIKAFSIPMAIMCVIGFLDVSSFDYKLKLIYILVTYVLYEALYTCVNVPFGSLSSVMTDDVNHRTDLSRYRSLGGTIFMTVVVIAGPLVLYKDNNPIPSRFTLMALICATIGVFCLISRTFATIGFSAFVPLAKYMIAVLLALAIQCLGVYQILLKIFTGLNPIRFIKKFFPVMAFAFSTATSNATIPLSIETLSKKVGVSKKISSFTIPLGATINMDGTSIMQGVAVVFAAQAFGIHLSMADYITVIGTATLASVGTAGVPSVGLVTLTMVFNSVGLPVEAIGLIMGIDRILDMTRTAVNITGDAVCTTIVAHQNKALDKKVFYETE